MVLSFTAVDYEGVTKDLGSSHNRKAESNSGRGPLFVLEIRG